MYLIVVVVCFQAHCTIQLPQMDCILMIFFFIIILWQLSDISEGGSTAFTQLEAKVSPEKVS